MKHFTVVWPVEIENQLAEMWLTVADPQQLTEDANLIDPALSEEPLKIGQEISLALRFADFGMVRVFYRVHPLDRMVKVITLKLLHK